MQILINENSINSITNKGRYPDAVVKNLQLWVKKPGTGGVLAEKFNSILGKVAIRDIDFDVHLERKDYEL